ncbi:tyrosine-protein phosphatase [Mangrovivirga cuniculi]|uniref:protein-tyrosine-phosphatase n=1 Tax=Mangrovivirga cuniculi TaxID=2715131 RepID=A0A4D7JQY2_9BACT|nr:CpsB/CapC family capsule biosynthesis tyrosine phosphatase [Mangrovivirga cuniculi]QCK17143.1 capsular biosynthesis protein [Mangrovivirga cuniculi]
MHSHILPGIDDGVKSVEESLIVIRKFIDLGYEKLIATPHIMSDFYKNTPVTISNAYHQVIDAVEKENLPISIDFAAEYYLDDSFAKKVENDEQLLTFGDNYLLFETSYINPPANIEEVIFLMFSKGLRPVWAHPERYPYLFENNLFGRMKDRGVLFQINANSLGGYYSPQAKKHVEKLIKEGSVDFVGSDCHKLKHLEYLESIMNKKAFRNLLEKKYLNQSL